MKHTIDVTGLPEDEVRMIKELVDYLKSRRDGRKKGQKKPVRTIECARWHAEIRGKLTREEIYEGR